MLRAKLYDSPFALPREKYNNRKCSWKDSPFVKGRKTLLGLPTNVLKKILRELLVRTNLCYAIIIRQKAGFGGLQISMERGTPRRA
ncbi:hypothetical protein OCU04_001270 [Sclerotinia nivalis]|uniref:Uncharacterized protein n=1 Tax=Sclerotinia nivalis TaxID=352851 RepID=A0A9X0AXS2_9HELO|nr:hypothetical protein OCU04_001270 [Sclerotinia nivalis]